MKELLSIGEVAKLKGLSLKALRYYERIGLLKPYFINPETNYRYYHIDQLLYLEFIVLFKKTGVGMHELLGILSSDDPMKIAEFSNLHIEIAQNKIRDLENSILLYQELSKKINSDRKLPEVNDPYLQYLDKRYIITADLDRSPLDYGVYDKYFAVYSLIRKKNYLTVYSTGTILDINLENLAVQYKSLYVEVLPAGLSPADRLEEIPPGQYLCVNFFQENKEAQLKKIAASLKSMNAVPKLTLQVDTFYDVTNYKNPLMELQCLVEE